MSPLHADAIRCLEGWPAPGEAQEQLRTRFLDVVHTRVDAMVRTAHPAHLTASALVVSADHREVLLTLHTKAGLWLQTGGHCEPEDGTLAEAALREATEESGIAGLAADPQILRLSRHEVPFCRPHGSDPMVPTEHLDVQFLLTAPAGATPVRSTESDDVRWFASDSLPDATDDEVRQLVNAGMRRLRGIP